MESRGLGLDRPPPSPHGCGTNRREQAKAGLCQAVAEQGIRLQGPRSREPRGEPQRPGVSGQSRGWGQPVGSSSVGEAQAHPGGGTEEYHRGLRTGRAARG